MVRRQKRLWASLILVMTAMALILTTGFAWWAPAPNPTTLKAAADILEVLDPQGQSLLLPGASKTPVSLWCYSWTLAAVEDATGVPGARTWAIPEVNQLTAGLMRYWDPYSDPAGFAPYPGFGPNTVKFFDDNAWVGIDLVTAYHLTGKQADLSAAEAAFRYDLSGWDPKGGGIFWNDLRQTRNTASNGPTAELAAMLYLDTHNPFYLSWGERIIHWEVGNLVNAQTGQVYDRLNASGQVVHQTYSYDAGSVMAADSLLYQATKNPIYLTRSLKIERYAARTIRRHQFPVPFHNAFLGVYADDLEVLYQVDPNSSLKSEILALNRALSPQHDIGAASTPDGQALMYRLLNETGQARSQAVVSVISRSPQL